MPVPHKQEFLNILINHVPAAVAFFDRDMRYIAASRRWLTDYGLGERDLTGRSHYEVFPEIPDDWKALHQRSLNGEALEAKEERFVRINGTVQWLHWVQRPWHAPDGGIGGIVILSEDITHRQEAEQRLRHMNGILDGIRKVNQVIARETDPHLLIQRSCEALAQTRGFTTVAIALTDGREPVISAHAMAGREMESLQNMLGQGCIPECATEAIATNAVVARNFEDAACDGCPVAPERRGDTDELTIAIRHGARLYGFMLVCMPRGMGDNPEESRLLQEIGNDIGFALHACRATSELDDAAANLAATEAQLRQAQKLESIGQLAGGIAHDFNNILAAQMGFCELMGIRLGKTHAQRPDLDKIKACAERAASLTRQLLAFSRKQALQPEVLDLNDVVSQVEKMLRRLIGEDIELRAALAGNLELIKVDRGQLEQVIMNLAVNARDAMPQGGKLSIETANIELDEAYAQMHIDVVPGPHVMLTISDNGEGMDAETQRRIFEPFFTTKAMGKGTGLGLSTVYGIVKQSGGNIWVYSEPGKGTTFKIYLPCVQEIPTAKAPVEPLHTGGRGESILIVEDDATLREVFVEMIGKMGYRVRAAGNASEALEAMQQGLKPDLLLTDVIMPGASGRVLAELLVAMQPGLRVIYTSGYTDDAIVHHGLIDEETEFLQKPFTSADLARKLRTVLEG